MAIDEEKLLIARVNDLYKKCDKYVSAVFGTFLDPTAQAVVNEKCINNAGYNSVWFGGYETSERNVLGVFNEWENPDNWRLKLSANIPPVWRTEIIWARYCRLALTGA